MSAAAELAILVSLNDRASGPLSALRDKFKSVSTQAIAIGAAMQIAGNKSMDLMRAPIAAFVEAEDAATRLKTTMLDASGAVRPLFGAINKLATELGDKLPGTTADFQNMMAALNQQGVAEQVILDGMGKTAAYIGVALKMGYEESAKFTVRLSNAAGVAAKDMQAFADTIVRTNGVGVDANEMGYAFSRSAGKLKEMGIQGLEASNALAPLYAGWVKVGMSGETVGTGFASILSNIQNFQYGLTKPAKAAKAELDALGIHLQFLDKNGKLKAIPEFVKELEKLKNLAPKLRASVIKDMFGTGQDAQMVATAVDAGLKGYQEMEARMKAQADLNTKVEMQLGTLKNVWEATTGTFTNALAAVAGALQNELKAVATFLGEASQWFSEFATAHPLLMKMVGGLLLFGGAALAVGGTGLMVVGVLAKFAGILAMVGQTALISRGRLLLFNTAKIAAEVLNSGSPLRAMAFHLGQIGIGARGAAAALGANMVRGLTAARTAVMLLGRAVLMNPIGLVLTAAAVLIYTYWKPIVGFFKGVWQGLQEGLAPIGAAFNAAFEPIRPMLDPVVTLLGEVWTWVKSLLNPVEDVGGSAQKMGRSFGLAVASVLKFIGKLVYGYIQAWASIVPALISVWQPIKAFFMGLWAQVKTAFNGGLLGMGKLILNWSPLGLFYKAFAAVLRWFGVKLPADFTGFGAMLLNGLMRGITAKLSAAKAAIVGFGENIKDWFKSALGINSPSKVFMGFGAGIGGGASLGILKSLPSMKSAVGKLSGLALAGAAMGVVPAGAGFAAALGGAGGAGGAAATSAGAGRAQVVFSPTIHVTVSGPGAASNAQGQVTQALHLSMAEFERLMQRYLQGKQRTGF